jgi:hypothetical protein
MGATALKCLTPNPVALLAESGYARSLDLLADTETRVAVRTALVSNSDLSETFAHTVG